MTSGVDTRRGGNYLLDLLYRHICMTKKNHCTKIICFLYESKYEIEVCVYIKKSNVASRYYSVAVITRDFDDDGLLFPKPRFESW